VLSAYQSERSFRVGRVDQAEDPARRLVNPVTEVADPVTILGLEISQMRVGDVTALTPPSIA
jgi:hypothetical protein